MKKWQALAYFLFVGGLTVALANQGFPAALGFAAGFLASVVNLWGLDRATNLIGAQWANREMTAHERLVANVAMLLKFPVAVGGFFLTRQAAPEAAPWFLGGFLLVYLPLIGRAQESSG